MSSHNARLQSGTRINIGGKMRGLSRRSVLKGVGVTMALPWLETMGGASSALAQTASEGTALTSSGAPLRMAFIFTPNGVNYQNWLPSGEGKRYRMSPTLEPLESVRRHVNIITGMTLDKARANGDGPGDHARSSASFLTGRQARKTSGNDIRLGISVDQFAASQVGGQTRLPSLEIGCENGRRAGQCDSGYSCAYVSNVSWRDEDSPVPKLIDPAKVFELMFGDPEQVEEDGDRERRIRRRKSVLDYVQEDSRQLERRLGAADRRKLEAFQDSIREIERRIQGIQNETSGRALPEDTPVPTGIPPRVGEHIDLMYDMLLLAFQTDTTRISTFMNGIGGSNRSFAELDIREGHHHLSHHRNNAQMVEKIRRIDRFYVERFARFIEKMAQAQEGEGSLLDNTMILFGSGICDGNVHNHENLPVLMAGGGGGTIDTGRIIRQPRETPLCNLYVSMLDRMGCDVASFGDSAGQLQGLTT